MNIDKKFERLLTKIQKPTNYCGGELGEVVKDLGEVKTRYAFCFPDTYPIGMSYLGMKILYSILNDMDGVWCERVFAPWDDMRGMMKKEGIPLYGLESGDPIKDFDLVGFTLQYEMSYTTILDMLDLAGIPLKSCERDFTYPIVCAGGPCAVNVEPMADFFDLVSIGDGETSIVEIVETYQKAKDEGVSKEEFLKRAAQIKSVYVPALYEVTYFEDGTIEKITPKIDGIPEKIVRRIEKDMTKVPFPKQVIVPYGEVVHDRIMLEVMRGCTRGCRFCQAGMIYRPVRERKVDGLCEMANTLYEQTGYDEITLSSLSTSDYSGLADLVDKLYPFTEENMVNLALPSLRVDNVNAKIIEAVTGVRKSGLTFAPEAGSQRLRDVINKNVSEENILAMARTAFSQGQSSFKLYFMMGLPTETMEDITAIVDTCQKIVDLYYKEYKQKGRPVHVTASTAVFVPKPFTPFQWEAQDDIDLVAQKQKRLKECAGSNKITVNWHDNKTSFLEAVFARGDRRLSSVIERAWRDGCFLDSWGEHFSYEKWMDAFEKEGTDPAFYANRKRDFDEVLPWDHIDVGISKEFLIREAKRAYEAKTTPSCMEVCSACGVAKLMGGTCLHG